MRQVLESVMLSEYETLIARAKVTRLDVAVDVTGVKPEELLIHDRNKRTTTCIYGQDGRLQTVYLGAAGSD